MKRLFTFVFTILAIACLTACSVPLKNTASRKNGLDSAFTANVSISLDKLQAEGIVSRHGSGLWDVEFSSPNSLSGIKLEFSEGNTKASYKGLSFSVPQSAVPVRAMMLNLMKAVDENASAEELSGNENDGSLEISGKLDGGSYTLKVDKEGRLSGFEMPNNSLKMTFTELRVISEAASGAEAGEVTTETGTVTSALVTSTEKSGT
ncbi:MAG: hypothetical protein IKI56_02365 [Ruminococcus sp.]|nr:hypothetical protein [Ruminococcus sp.]